MSDESHRGGGQRQTRLGLLAQRQGGAVSTNQIRSHDLSSREQDGLARMGWLRREHRGVWRIGILTPDGHLWAAWLAMGPESTISILAAGHEHGLLDGRPPRPIDVTCPTQRRPRRGIRPHEARLDPADVVVRRGLPFTRVARTLLDLAAVLPSAQLDFAVDEARNLRRLHPPTIEAAIARAPGHHGIGRLRTSIARHAPGRGMPRGKRERVLARFLAERDYPAHERNAQVRIDDEVFTVDVLFLGKRVVLEFDSRQFHDNDPKFDSDRRRIRRFAANGWHLIPLTSTDLVERPDELDRDVRDILGIP